MKTDPLTLNDLLGGAMHFRVPIFQRRYVWTKEDQWEPLWSDLVEVARRQMPTSDADADTRRPHFLGAIVLQQQENDAFQPKLLDVIDGQQRLITLQLLIAAAESVLTERDAPQALFLGDLLRNDEKFAKQNPDHRLKVMPTTHDRQAFRETMALTSGEIEAVSPEVKTSRIYAGYQFFREKFEKWFEASDVPVDGDQRASALLEALKAHFLVVGIQASDEDEANMIFETLNARGTPLLAWDLTKNSIINAVEGGIDLTALDQNWWQEEVGARNKKRTRVDDFLITWLTMRTHSAVPTRSPRDVFQAFERYAKPQGQEERSVTGIAQDLLRVSSAYREMIELDDSSSLGLFLRRWRALPPGSFAPIVLWLCSELDRDEASHLHSQQQATLAMESYFIRRTLCGLSTGGGGGDLRDSALELLGTLTSTSPEDVGDCVVSHFKRYFRPDWRLRWPTNAEVEQALTSTFWFYDKLTQARARMILTTIEAEMRDPIAAEQEPPDHLTIEHILPQSWQEKVWPWPPDSEMNDDDLRAARKNLIHTIGNLTLVTAKLNPKLSNGPWRGKRKQLDGSVLAMNKRLLKDSTQTRWDERHIQQRSRQLAQICNDIWPEPDKIT